MIARWIPACAMAASIGAGCAATAQNGPAATPAPRITVATRANATITGQPLGLPPSPWETVISVTDLPPGGVLPMHKHPWPRYAYVDRGRLSVTYEAAGLTREFGPGEAVVEAIDQWHEGRVVGTQPVRLIVLDQLPPGATNVVLR
jgi:quercetin dioxygenase-like cupin family protein